MGGKFMPSMIHLRNTYKISGLCEARCCWSYKASPASDVSLSNLASLLILKALFPVVTMDIQ